MIRIKVFSVRQAINSFMFYLLILAISIFVLFIFASSFYILKEMIKDNYILQNDFDIVSISRNSLIENIYSNEFIFSNFEEPNDVEVKLAQNNVSENKDIDKTNDYEIKENSFNVEVNEKKEYAVPDKYDVELYENGKVRVGNTIITNYTKRSLDLNALSKPSDIVINNNLKFLLFHTHATESYTFKDTTNVANYRTIDKRYNMVSVGNVLYERLKAKGYDCVHDEELHDYPSYNGAYKSSLATVEKYIQNQKYDFVIDIHRDALSSNLGFRPTVNINGESVAKLMFVVGTNACGLSHDDWMKNLKLAIMIQNRANEMYPGFFRDLNLSKSRYNQHVSNGAFIIEVGATGNTLEEAQNAMKYLANVIDSFVH